MGLKANMGPFQIVLACLWSHGDAAERLYLCTFVICAGLAINLILNK